MTTTEKKRLARIVDEDIRDRHDAAYEVLYDKRNDAFVIAAPRDEDEGGDPDQPTAVVIGPANNYDPDDPEELFWDAVNDSQWVDELVKAREEDEEW